MVQLRPIPVALVPNSSASAREISGPNYDEFQTEQEIRERILARPSSILKVTMPHCDPGLGAAALEEGSDAALDHAQQNLKALEESDKTKLLNDALFVYAIDYDDRIQIGVGGMARTSDIKSDRSPEGTIVRNEKIHEYKAEGRARLIERTRSFVGIVNLCVSDSQAQVTEAIQTAMQTHPETYRTEDELGRPHRIWIITDPDDQAALRAAIESEPQAFVADGNHRSAAAQLAQKEDFLAVFFVLPTMRILPYHRLVEAEVGDQFMSQLEADFEVAAASHFHPDSLHEIGLYAPGQWFQLRVKPDRYSESDPVSTIDAEIVQRLIFEKCLGINDPRDPRLRYVGGDRSLDYLEAQVNSGEFNFALAMPPVTLDQFVAICKAEQFMPPKSTWFDPKVRSGLIVALNV